MLLQDIIDNARFSELASTNIKDNKEAIVSFINLGMIELYKRFPIRTNEHIIQLVEGTTIYDMPADFMYAVSAYGEVPINSLVQVLELPINDEDDPYSIFFPNHTQTQIPAIADGIDISIIYVAKPERYTTDDLGAEIDLPDTLIDCLLHFIGYRAHLGIRSDGQSENNAHFLRFERSCDKARELGVAYPIDSWRMASRLSGRGFV